MDGNLATAFKMECEVGDGWCCGLVDVALVVELLAQAASTFQRSLAHQVGSPRELRKSACAVLYVQLGMPCD